jgi:hypothetical protein
VDREGEAGALTNALKMPIDCISCKWPSPLGREDITTIGKLPAQLAQCPDFLAAEWMNRRLAVLDPADMQGSGPAELNLAPFQIANLAGPQAVSEGNQDQGSVPVAVPPLSRLLDQLFDLGRRQVFAGPQLGIWQPNQN